MFQQISYLSANSDPKVILKGAIFASVLSSALYCGAGLAQQQSGSQQGRSQAKSNTPSPPRTAVADSRKMELEERRRLRQEIQRHGPNYRVKDSGAGTSAAAAASLSSQSPPILPVPPPVALPAGANPGLAIPNSALSPNFPGPAPAAASMLPYAMPRGSTMTNEERQQLRQQIREERRRGAFPTPSEVDR
jgi:hypothetical protein